MKDNGTEDMMMHGIKNDKVCLYDEAELWDTFNGLPLKGVLEFIFFPLHWLELGIFSK